MMVKNGDSYREMGEEDYKKLSELREESVHNEEWYPLCEINEEGDTIIVDFCQFEGNESEGWLTVQAGDSSEEDYDSGVGMAPEEYERMRRISWNTGVLAGLKKKALKNLWE